MTFSQSVSGAKPRIRVVPSCVDNDGEFAVELATRYGYVPDEWQADVLRSWLGRDENDLYCASTCGLIVPRQNGKNAIVEMRELFGAVVLGEKILHTAHEVKTSMKAFQRVKQFFGDKKNDEGARYPELNALVSKISNVNGQEGIFLKNGGSIEFSSRSRGASRGFTVDVTIYDEAQELTVEQQAASLPAKSAAPLGNPQTIYIGTPPTPNAECEVFKRVRESAINGSSRMCWHEWSANEIGNVDDRSRWYECNPAMPHRISEEAVADELANMPKDSFARERLAWWPDEFAESAISVELWDACSTDGKPSDGGRHFAVKFSPDGAFVSLSVCVADEKPYLNVIDRHSMRDGTQWLADWLTLRADDCESITIDGTSSQYLIEKLDANGFDMNKVITPRSSDMSDACDMLNNALVERRAVHFNQTSVRDAVMVSRRRNIGRDGWGFAGEGSDMLESIALAHRAALVKRKPRTRMMVAF